MKKAATYLRENRDELIHVMSQETGGTLIKSNIELDLTLEVLDAAPNFTDQIYTVQEAPSGIPGKTNRIYRLPLGVYLLYLHLTFQ